MEIGHVSKKVDMNDGEWVDDIPDLDGVRLKVRSTKFKPFEVASSALIRRFGKRLRTDEGVIAFRAASGGPLADHILIDWDMTKAEGSIALTKEGKPLPYSREDARFVLTVDDDYGIGQIYRQGVEWAGDRVAEQIAARAEQVAGN
ncbi:hypothetical protein U5A82_17410 [Sphingobium sp. CR2-8]|uniref:hypothetical protein n=1 Tax=Sphingobium sp. CR2-8 TaxID=1306534 RepID=UPI002DB7924A|nr:hypothetical protein [Sphingobium sp. CR2-8]MEC3912187.1 hypothetical protein [Sphingobium sp. CR2-8]